jgi:predicted acylesterase/phospholipase RssA
MSCCCERGRKNAEQWPRTTTTTKQIQCRPFTILSMDGGGVRGALILRFLARLEQEIATRRGLSSSFSLMDRFDMVAGSSIGCVIAMCVSISKNEHVPPMTFRTLDQRMTIDTWGRLCDKSWMDRILGRAQCDPLYDGRAKTQLLKEWLGIDSTLESSSKLLLFPVYNLQCQRIQYFSNQCQWSSSSSSSQGGCDIGTAAWRIADAASAPPTYFPSVAIESTCCCRGRQPLVSNRILQLGNNAASSLSHSSSTSPINDDDEQKHNHNCHIGERMTPVSYMDGGVQCNNPSLDAYMVAKRVIGGGDDNNIRILSVGSGRTLRPMGSETASYGGVEWVEHGLIDILTSDTRSEELMNFMFESRPNQYIRVNDDLARSIALDDSSPESIRELWATADRWFDMYRDVCIDMLT